MAPYRSCPTMIAMAFGLLFLAGTAPAHARGGAGAGHGMMTAHSGSAATAMPGSPSRSSPSSGSGRGSGPASSSSVIIGNTGPLPFPTITPSTGPSDNLPPRQELPQIAPPLPQLPEQFSTGGSTGTNMALSPGSSSPSESAPSAPGGGGKDLAACMGFWEPATHMNKREWRGACLRTMEEFPSL